MTVPDRSIPPAETRLVEVLDRLLDRGVAIKGELWLTVADVDLVYVGLQAVIASPDRVFGDGSVER